jgi:hypothetical protein
MIGMKTEQEQRLFTDWERTLHTNHVGTAAANWASVKHQYSEEDLEKMRPWLAWITVENIKEMLENTRQIAKSVASYPMIRHLSSRFRILNFFRLREIVSTDTIFSSWAVGGLGVLGVLWADFPPHGCLWDEEQKPVPRGV